MIRFKRWLVGSWLREERKQGYQAGYRAGKRLVREPECVCEACEDVEAVKHQANGAYDQGYGHGYRAGRGESKVG